ncbi:MAG: bifunctional nuclease family protein [Anaerolineae bacterium]
MIKVEVATIQVSLVSPHRIVVLQEIGVERYLPIWIGACEAEAISMHLQNIEPPRPMTHDLIVNMLETLGASLDYVLVHTLANDTFYGSLFLDVGGELIEMDSRPSDAIAIAVRFGAPIYVDEAVMDEAGVVPEKNLLKESVIEDEEDLDVFRDFLNNIDLDDLPTD